MDTFTSAIWPVDFKPSSDADRPVRLELFDQTPAGYQVGTVTADGAYDSGTHSTVVPRNQ